MESETRGVFVFVSVWQGGRGLVSLMASYGLLSLRVGGGRGALGICDTVTQRGDIGERANELDIDTETRKNDHMSSAHGNAHQTKTGDHIMATVKKAAAAPKKAAATKAPKDIFSSVSDNIGESSAVIVWDLMNSEADYATRVTHQGVILAKRIAAGEKQADIVRELIEIGKENGKTITRDAAAQRVSRYSRIGMAIVKSPKGEALTDTIAKASKAVRGTKGPKVAPKSNDEKAGVMLDSIIKLIAKCTQAELEKLDTAISSVVVDAIATRYAELEKVAAA